MDFSIKRAREKIREKCERDENYVISKFEAYILICDTVMSVIQLFAYEKMEEKIKNQTAAQEDIVAICNDVFGQKSPVCSVAKNMKIKNDFSKEEVAEYKDIFDDFVNMINSKKNNEKKM